MQTFAVVQREQAGNVPDATLVVVDLLKIEKEGGNQ